MRTVLIVAQSLDGYITQHDRPGTDWTSPADKKWFRTCLAPFDASVMGRVTYEVSRDHILAHLSPHRCRVVMTQSPELFRSDAQPPTLEFSAETAAQLVQRLSAMGRKQCAILGGTKIHDAFFAAGLVDEVWATVEPKVFGTGTPLTSLPHDVSLRLESHERLPDSNSVLLRYTVVR